MRRPTTVGKPSIIGAAASLATTVSPSLEHTLGQGPLSCKQSSTTKLTMRSFEMFDWTNYSHYSKYSWNRMWCSLSYFCTYDITLTGQK